MRRLDAVQSGCPALSIVKQGDLMVVANVHLKPNLSRKSLLTDHEFLCAGTTVVADVV
jgi:hypothetical protein